MATMHNSRFLFLGAVFAGLAVAAGAFGAHMLRPVLDATMLGAFETGARYQMYHALALCLLAGIAERNPTLRVAAVGWLFLKFVCARVERGPMGGCLHAARWSGLDHGLGAAGVDRSETPVLAHGVQDAVRFPLTDPQPPWELTNVPSSRCPSLENKRLSSWTFPSRSQRR